jgi:hypothetical protein
MIVWLKPCPMCSRPVTLGGGNWMENDGLAGSVPAVKYPRASQSGAQRASMAAGSKLLASSVGDALWVVIDEGAGNGRRRLANPEFYGNGSGATAGPLLDGTLAGDFRGNRA